MRWQVGRLRPLAKRLSAPTASVLHRRPPTQRRSGFGQTSVGRRAGMGVGRSFATRAGERLEQMSDSVTQAEAVMALPSPDYTTQRSVVLVMAL